LNSNKIENDINYNGELNLQICTINFNKKSKRNLKQFSESLTTIITLESYSNMLWFGQYPLNYIQSGDYSYINGNSNGLRGFESKEYLTYGDFSIFVSFYHNSVYSDPGLAIFPSYHIWWWGAKVGRIAAMLDWGVLKLFGQYYSAECHINTKIALYDWYTIKLAHRPSISTTFAYIYRGNSAYDPSKIICHLEISESFGLQYLKGGFNADQDDTSYWTKFLSTLSGNDLNPTLPISFSCPYYSKSYTNYALQNYASCSIYACPGQTIRIDGCGCYNDQILRLYDSSNNEVAADDDGDNNCGFCSKIFYTVLGSNCQTFRYIFNFIKIINPLLTTFLILLVCMKDVMNLKHVLVVLM
jgi:hypothetical protein